MKTKTLIIALTLSIGLCTACAAENKTEEKIETEISSEENITSDEGNVEKAEVRRLDSIRQVKEHGHAH